MIEPSEGSLLHPHSPAPDTCLLFLVRHGATDNNLANPPRLQGCGSDLGLSAHGRAQAEDAGRCLAVQPLKAVYCSPLRRACETAEWIARPHGLTVESVPNLKECDVGTWEGRSWVDIEREEPEAYQQFMMQPELYGYAGGENMTQLLERTAPALEGLMARHVGEAIAAVAHNVVNRAYLASKMGLSMAAGRGVPQHNCGINVVRYRRGDVKVLTVNSVFHLRDW